MNDTMHIVRLRAENVKRLRAVEITPQGELVRISGRNGQGKSSVLDAIAYAIGGKALCPRRPVREGARSAEVFVDLGALRVTRRWTSDDHSYLEVAAADGRKQTSPQAVLDELLGPTWFDPLEFARAKPAQQRDTLLALTGLGDRLAELDRARRDAYDTRTRANRDLKQAEAALKALPIPPAAPAGPVAVADITAELARRQEVARHNADERAKLATLRAQLQSVRDGVTRWQERVAELQRQLDEARAQLAHEEHRVAAGERIVAEADARVSALVDPDTADLTEQLAAAERAAAAAGLRDRRAEAEARLDALRGESDALTAELERIDGEKAALLAGARWPIDGLGFDDDGVTLGGVPWDQASQAEQLRAAMAIAMAAQPRLRVLLIRDGSLLDSTSLEIVREMAAGHDYQVWVETVSDGDPVGITIEDGQVVSA